MKYSSTIPVLFVLFSTSFAAQAAVNIKPGLWEVKSTVTTNGQKVDMSSKVKEALDKMPPEKRAELEKKIDAKTQAGDSGGYQVCYTKDLLDREDAFGRQKENERCSHNVKSQTPGKVVVDFKCRDGTAGTSEWNVIDQEHYQGKVVMTSAKRPKTEIDHAGTFISADCGQVKPLVPPPRKSAHWDGRGRAG